MYSILRMYLIYLMDCKRPSEILSFPGLSLVPVRTFLAFYAAFTDFESVL